MSEITKIGNYEITDADIDLFIDSLPKEQQMYKNIPQFRDQVKGKLVEMYLFALDGKDSELDKTEDYKKAIETAEREIISSLAVSKLIAAIDCTEEEMKDYFENNKYQFTEDAKAGAKHILVDSEEKANEIKEEIAAGTKTFEDAAKEYSTCPSKAKGGDLGIFGRGQMVAEFDEVAFTGEMNKVLGPVKTQFGYHLITIYSRKDAGEPVYENVKSGIRQQLLQIKQMKAYNEKVEELKAKYMK